MFNGAMTDIEQTFNTPQPIAYGGTGATTAVGGADALSPAFVNVASAATTNIGAAASPNVNITGTANITAFDTATAGIRRYIVFSGASTLTHNATSMILPNNGANIVTAAGDTAEAVSLGSGNWRVSDYTRASGSSVSQNSDVFRNRMVNSGKTISQENGQTSGTTNGRYLSDQNAMYFVSSAGTFTGVNVQTISPAGGYRDRITITVADAALAAGEYLTYTQNLEGSNVRDFKWGAAGANQVVIRFGIKAPAGTYAMALHNNGATRSYVAMFTITAPQANTDTVQTFAVPGDVTGTWLTADGVIGITMDIVLAAGTTFQGVAGWQAGNILATSAVSNGMGTAAAVFEFFDAGMRLDVSATGVYGSYEVGYTDAVYRSERYYELRPTESESVLGTNRTDMNMMPWLVPKAKLPTLLIFSSTTNTGTNNLVTRNRLTGFTISGAGAFEGVVSGNARL